MCQRLMMMIACCFSLGLDNAHCEDVSQEPPLQYTLEIDGKSHPVTLEKPLQIQGTLENPTITLSASSTREFPYGDIRFQYPSYFTWEAEIEGPRNAVWTLSGNDFKIMYFLESEDITIKEYLDAFVEQFGKENCQVSKNKRKLGTTTYPGEKILIDLSGIELTMEVYLIPSKTGSRLLVLQDSPAEGDPLSGEAAGTLKLMGQTFVDTQN